MVEQAVIFGLSGPQLTAEETQFFKAVRPWGFILFARNCVEPNQLRELTDSLRDLTGRTDLPILVDEEGGRVQTAQAAAIGGRRAESARHFGNLWRTRSRLRAEDAAYWHGRLMAHDLREAGHHRQLRACCADLDEPGPRAKQLAIVASGPIRKLSLKLSHVCYRTWIVG